jgi:cyclic pyranopterin phosphate synthase
MTDQSRDLLGRPLGSVRLSVTDRCNLRCQYCMPEEHYTWLPRDLLLTFEEIARLSRVFASLGAGKVRLTGGEPLLRRDLPALVTQLRAVPQVDEIALTTNGMLLAEHAVALKAAGLDRVTVSLDTLRPERMLAFARSARHSDVLAGIDAVIAAGFADTKLNSVVVRGYNDDELVAMVQFAKARGIEARFIEYMDVGGATQWHPADVVSRTEILNCLAAEFGDATPVARDPDQTAPAERFRFADGTVIGIVASTTAPFCRTCDRARLTADGTFFLCLYAERGLDLRAPLRAGATDAELAGLVAQAWRGRSDRGAEVRAALPGRGVLVPLEGLKADLRREMHVRGG